jgi:hypothetical protein
MTHKVMPPEKLQAHYNVEKAQTKRLPASNDNNRGDKIRIYGHLHLNICVLRLLYTSCCLLLQAAALVRFMKSQRKQALAGDFEELMPHRS